MASNQGFLVNGLNPTQADNEFQVRTAAVRIFGANLGIPYNLQVLVGDQNSSAWVNYYFNGVQQQLTDTNNVLVLIVSGQYRVVTSDDSEPISSALAWFSTSDETDHDNNTLYVLQTPAPPGGGGGGGPSPGDTVTEVGVAFGRTGNAGSDTTYSREDHTHSFDVLPASVGNSAMALLTSATTTGGSGGYVIQSVVEHFSTTTRELAIANASFTLQGQSINTTPPVTMPFTTFTDSGTGLEMGLIDLASFALDESPGPTVVTATGNSVRTGTVQISQAEDGSAHTWVIEINAIFALVP